MSECSEVHEALAQAYLSSVGMTRKDSKVGEFAGGPGVRTP